jgi:hypothetical protein
MPTQNTLLPSHPFRTLLQWFAWVSVSIAVYAVLYAGTDLWNSIQSDQSRVTVVILVLFLIGLLLSFTLTMALTREVKQAILLGSVARDQGLVAVTPRLGRYATHRFFASLKTATSGDRMPPVDSLIEMELNGYHRRSDTIGVVGNLLITLGLIGTVVGLTFTLGGLSSALEALGTDQEELSRGLRVAMSGMGTAFYTTLLGSVLGGVLLRIFALITSNGIGDLADTLKRIAVHCTGDVRPTVEGDTRRLNQEIVLLGENARMLQEALRESVAAMEAFRAQAASLHEQSDDADRNKNLRDAVALQMYYTDLLKDEIRLMTRVNRAWWPRLRRALRRRTAARSRPR